MDEPEHLETAAQPVTEPSVGVVAIGASAGGLAAMQTFLSHVPERSGLAYVVIMHLSSEYESRLPEVLQPSTAMPVDQIVEAVELEPDRVYVIPPGRNIEAVDSHLRLSSIEPDRGARAPIDHFFRTLAKSGGLTIGVILSGTGSDGTLGVKALEQTGGLVIVQDPKEAEYDGMPQSAIATGLVDLVLPVAEIPAAILRYVTTQPSIEIPDDDDDVEGHERQLLTKLFAQVRRRTSRDFSRYKRSTILRRIQRRMQLHQLERLEDYLGLLRDHPEEVRALADEFLVTVTNFFRDPEVFEALARDVIPRLFDGKAQDDTVRVWSVGCATGEEAYSLAMLLLEESSRREAPQLQVFASDLHEQSLRVAREGVYSGNIDADVSPERLRRFFVQHGGGYRVRQELRDLVIFAPHNLLADPPFSKIDLIMCRNLLIYLQREVQRDVVELFHYALQPGGFLILGSSETVGRTDLFRVEDKAHCFFSKRNVPTGDPRLPVFSFVRGGAQWPAAAADPSSTAPISYARLHSEMIERHAPPSVLINQDHNIVHLSADAGRYLRVPGGEPTANVFKLVREELRLELRTALHTAERSGLASRTERVTVDIAGELVSVVVQVWPSDSPDHEGLTLLVFDEHEAAGALAEPAELDASARDVQAELDATKQRLQALIDKYETSQEEMKASNEELQSANEELRSTMEELETSKEELQSVNEELSTLNQENRNKVEELSKLSSDLQNLMAATDIATLFLDRELRILQFTPQIGELFNVRTSDRGRPLTDLTHRLGYAELASDARQVLAKLTPIEREIQHQDGRWYLARVLPYRSTTDHIGGVVLTLLEVTARKLAEQALRRSAEADAFRLKLTDAVRPLVDPVEIQTTAARLLGSRLAANRVLYVELREAGDRGEVRTGYTSGVAPIVGEYRFGEFGPAVLDELRAGRTVVVTDVGEDPRIAAPAREAARALEIGAFVAVPVIKDSSPVGVYLVEQREPRSWTAHEIALMEETVERMWTAAERAQAAIALRDSEDRYRAIVEQGVVGVAVSDLEGRITYVNDRLAELLGYAAGELRGVELLTLIHSDDRAQYAEQFARLSATGEPFSSEKRYLRKNGSSIWVSTTVASIREAGGTPGSAVALIVDARDRRRAEQAVTEARRKDEFLATLAHELRNPLAPISTALTLLRRGDGNGRTAELLAVIERQVALMVRLVEDLLDVSRITRGAIQLRKQPVDLAATIHSAIETSGPLLANDQRRLSVELPSEPIVVDGDPARLVQIVSNLLNNAAKYTGEGGRIWLTLDRAGDRARLSVRDDGIGIAADMLPKVFDMFAQADRSRTDGLGVGLALVRSLVEMHDGSVEVHSEGLGRGSEFVVTLPVSRAPAAVPLRPAEQPATRPEKQPAARRRTLIVDDNVDAADTLGLFLEQLGADVRVVYDGPSALKIVEDWAPELVFLDLGLPGMDGYEVARTIRRSLDSSRCVLVAVTGWGQEQDRRRSREAGFDQHLLKPASVEAISKLLES